MLKKLISLQNKQFASIWLLFHLAVIIPFCVSLAGSRRITVDADLFNMLPKPVIGKAMGVADTKLTEKTGQNVFILVSHPDFNKAKAAAEQAYAQLKDSPGFKSVSLYSDLSSLSTITGFIHENRWNMLDSQAVDELSTKAGAETFAQNALAKAYTGFTMSSLENLETDPFMLDEYNLQNYLKTVQTSGTAMSPKDGVLASEKDGRWYIMMSGILSKQGAALASKTNAVAQIQKVCGALEKDDVRFVYSGTPFHSYKSSTSASQEITIISTITMLTLIILLVYVFRNALPILFSVGSILLSLGTAFCVTHLLFGRIHMLTLVFGTSLIGSCIDYSLHFFINWKANNELHSGVEIRKHLIVGLTLSLISTELCYLILVFAPFNLLKQMAIFSLFGILSSYLTVICLYPLLPVPVANRTLPLVNKYRTPSWFNKKKVGYCVLGGFFVVTISLLSVFHKNIGIQNNVAKLYKMEGRVLEDEKTAGSILKYNPSGWFIVTGKTAQETLENEEMLTAQLDNVNAGKERGGYICTTKFIPSIAKQKRSREAAEKLFPLAASQYEALGYDEKSVQLLKKEFLASEGKYLTPDGKLPDFLASAVTSAWLGEIDGNYYSVVLPVSVTDEDAYNKIADSNPNFYFENKIKDINRNLDSLTKTILILFGIAYVFIVVVLKIFYSWKNTLKVASIPLLIVLVIGSVFAARGIKLEFFSITGMILVFGLGLDYVIYMIENEKRSKDKESSNLEPFAILLSFLTTAVSFGALALSSFVPVHMLGLTIFLGLTTAFLCTIL